MKLYEEQKGLCKYSGRKMTFKIHCTNHISIDRIDNNKWYEKKIQNPKDEWDKMYKLLLKYDKLRVPA